MSVKTAQVTKDDILQIIQDLRKVASSEKRFYSIDQVLCSLNKIILTETIGDSPLPFAAISLHNNEIVLYINPVSFARLDEAQQCFVILHEAMHILFDRFDFLEQAVKDGDRTIANWALDYPINALLNTLMANIELKGKRRFKGSLYAHKENFGNLEDHAGKPIEHYIFKGELKDCITATTLNKLLPKGTYLAIDTPYSSDTIFYKLKNTKDEITEKTFVEIGMGIGSKKDLEEKKETIKRIAARSKPSEKDSLLKHAGEDDSYFALQLKRNKIDSLISSLTDIAQKITLATGKRERIIEEESWLFPSRRTFNLSSNSKLILPGKNNLPLQRKLRALVLIDVSGSCMEIAPTFVQLAKAIPKEYYDTIVYRFDTQCHKIDLSKDSSLLAGGGTCYGEFSELEREINPDIAIVFTDGYGTSFGLSRSNLWYFFLTNGCYDNHVPSGCRLYEMNDDSFKYRGIKS